MKINPATSGCNERTTFFHGEPDERAADLFHAAAAWIEAHDGDDDEQLNVDAVVFDIPVLVGEGPTLTLYTSFGRFE